MSRPLLQFLLALSLILNGISAPWAMSRMSHGDDVAGSTHAAHDGRVGASESGAMTHHGHQQHASASGDAGLASGHADHGNCCDGFFCQCGCVLPPMLELRAMGAPSLPDGPSDGVAAEWRLVPLRTSSPPFRPPAA